MKKNITTNLTNQRGIYESPEMFLFSLVGNTALTASNTERIEEDDEEYGWD